MRKLSPGEIRQLKDHGVLMAASGPAGGGVLGAGVPALGGAASVDLAITSAGITLEAIGVLSSSTGAVLAASGTGGFSGSGSYDLPGHVKPKDGSAGGPGSAKRFAESTKDTAEAQADGKCVFCGRETTRSPGGTQRNTDHAIPKSRGGNNNLDNAQNTCLDRNLDKRTQTTQEYLDRLRQGGGR